MLLNAGFNNFESLDNGLDCVFEIKRSDIPDVIFIDKEQYVINGFEILKNISNSNTPTRIIVLMREDSELNTHIQYDASSPYFMKKSTIDADNIAQLLYTIFTKKIRSTKMPPRNKVFSSLRRSFTGMLNFYNNYLACISFQLLN